MSIYYKKSCVNIWKFEYTAGDRKYSKKIILIIVKIPVLSLLLLYAI
jgi:hypothetical protein